MDPKLSKISNHDPRHGVVSVVVAPNVFYPAVPTDNRGCLRCAVQVVENAGMAQNRMT